ncbi:MAG: hypothetical protein KF799_00995 [Bdellovibrionales bacterium]|nr:hypothetical protein [Bdellovibrionales bacterium]
MMKAFASISILALVTTAPSAPAAEQLSNVALYYRCYAQITQLRVPAADARLAAVKAGTKDPIAACLEVLDSARLTAASGTTLGNSGDTVAQAVLRTFQGLHYSWFTAKQYVLLVNSSPSWTNATYDVFDPSSPALYYTKALFDPNASYKDVITSADNLRPVRTVASPTRGVYSGQSQGSFASGATTPLVPTGVLLGAAPSGVLTAGGLEVGTTAGGGYLGTIPYIQTTVAGDVNFAIDGAVNTPRRWGRALFQDVLCRPLPVARTADVTSLVVAGAQAPFRQSAACTKCHASMDRAASVIRNFKYFSVTTDGAAHSAVGIKFSASSVAAETSWPATGDSSFSKRPTNGTLFYRSYDGTLINTPVTSVADIGAKLANYDDFYICAAKRYFQYFTGINADIGDLNDPDYGHTLSAADLAVRQTVIDLGKKLRSTQKTRLLIEDILKLPQYRSSDFGLAGN